MIKRAPHSAIPLTFDSPVDPQRVLVSLYVNRAGILNLQYAPEDPSVREYAIAAMHYLRYLRGVIEPGHYTFFPLCEGGTPLWYKIWGNVI